MKADNYTAVPTVDQEVVDDNAAVAIALDNSGINNTSTANPTGPVHMITKYHIN